MPAYWRYPRTSIKQSTNHEFGIPYAQANLLSIRLNEQLWLVLTVYRCLCMHTHTIICVFVSMVLAFFVCFLDFVSILLLPSSKNPSGEVLVYQYQKGDKISVGRQMHCFLCSCHELMTYYLNHNYYKESSTLANRYNYYC